jgi:hypothetical protein
MATHSLIAVAVTLVVATAVISFIYGWIACGNYSHRYQRDRAEAVGQRKPDFVRARCEAERPAQPVVNVYIAAPVWPPAPLPPRTMPVIDEQVVRGLPAGWS